MTQIMDVDSFKLNFQGVESVALNIIEIFEGQSKLLLEKISVSIETKSAKDLELSAHSLKGAVASFYAEKCRTLSFELEIKGKSQNFEGATQILKELRLEVAALNRCLIELKDTLV